MDASGCRQWTVVTYHGEDAWLVKIHCILSAAVYSTNMFPPSSWSATDLTTVLLSATWKRSCALHLSTRSTSICKWQPYMSHFFLVNLFSGKSVSGGSVCTFYVDAWLLPVRFYPFQVFKHSSHKKLFSSRTCRTSGQCRPLGTCWCSAYTARSTDSICQRSCWAVATRKCWRAELK